MFTKDARPSVASRVSWILHKMKETEGIALLIAHSLREQNDRTNELIEKLSQMDISKWHRWFEVERVDVITANDVKKNLVSQGRDTLHEKIRRLGTPNYFKNNFYLEIKGMNMMIAQIVWKEKTGASVYFGFIGTTAFRIDTFAHIIQSLKYSSQLYVFKRPLCNILIKTLKQANNQSNIYSLFNFRPIDQAIVAFMFNSNRQWSFLCEHSARRMCEISFTMKTMQNFIYLGKTENGSKLLIKPIELSAKCHKEYYFLQNLLYIRGNDTFSEFYIEPDAASCEEKTEREILKEFEKTYEIYDRFVYSALLTFDFLMYRSLQSKLNDNDLGTTQSPHNEQIIEISEDDNLYCYYDQADHINTADYDEIKLAIYSSMYTIFSKYSYIEVTPFMKHLLKNSVKSFTELDVYFLINTASTEVWISGLTLLYHNLISGFRSLADYYTSSKAIHYFIRVISGDVLLIWTLPNLNGFIEHCLENKTFFYLEKYECSSKNIHPSNLMSTSNLKSTVELNKRTKKILINTLSLIQSVYRSIYNTTCYQRLLDKETAISRSQIKGLINTCEHLSDTIYFPLLSALNATDFTSPEALCSQLLRNSIVLSNQVFNDIDHRLSDLLEEDFFEISAGMFILKDSKDKLLLTIGDNISKLTDALYSDSLEIRVYLFNSTHFFSTDWRKTITSYPAPDKHGKEKRLLQRITQKLHILLSEYIVEYIRYFPPITERSFSIVYKYLQNIQNTTRVDYEINLIRTDKDYTKIVHNEFMKGQAILLQRVSQYYFIISNDSRKSFYLKEEMEAEECSLTQPSETYYIPFWVVIEFANFNQISALFFLPSCLHYEQLAPFIVQEQLIAWFRTQETHINQRILLENLVLTENISSLLVPIKEREKKIRRSTRPPLKPTAEAESKNEDESPYLLHPQHQTDFLVSERVTKGRAMSELTTKFSIAPFIINNCETLFKLEKDSNVYVFRFFEDLVNNESLVRNNSYATVGNKVIRFQILGIDPPDSETVKHLEYAIQEKLEQISLENLADSLVKNQKSTITVNDTKFIQGQKRPKIFYYAVNDILEDPLLLCLYAKQNLSKYFNNVTCEGKSVLLYNYMTVIGASTTKPAVHFRSRQHEEKATFLGNTYGKALALIYSNACYFDGENISLCQESMSRLEPYGISRYGVVWLNSYIEPYISPRASRPITPGYYLELSYYTKGPLNKSVFIDYLDSSIKQCITEQLLELFFRRIREIQDTPCALFKHVTHYTKQLINQSIGYTKLPINHYAPPFTLFEFFQSCVATVDSALEAQNVPFWACIQEDDDCKCISSAMSQLQEHWKNNYFRDKAVGKRIQLGSMWGFNLPGQDYRTHLSEELKQYPSLQNATRSLFIYIEILPTSIQVFSYNLNKALLSALYANLELHISWVIERSKLLNNALTQKLGLHYHNCASATPQLLRMRSHETPQHTSTGCSTLELNRESRSFPFESLVNHHEKTHSPLLTEERLSNFKVQGLYPLVKNRIVIKTYRDKVEQHGRLLQSLFDLKGQLYEACNRLAFAYCKWCPQNQATLAGSIAKILSKGQSPNKNEGILVNSLLKQATLFFYDKSLCHFVRVNPLDPTLELDTERELASLKKVLEFIIKSYSQELKKALKFEVIAADEPSTSLRTFSQGLPSAPLSVHKQHSRLSGSLVRELPQLTIYLRKAFGQTMLFLEVSIDESSSLSLSAYSFENLQQHIQVNQWEDAMTPANTRKELYKLVNEANITSYMYNIQLKLLVFYLCQQSDYPTLNIVATLSSLYSSYKQAPPNSTNWLYSGQVVIDLGELEGISAEEIYEYIYWNCNEYGLKNTQDKSYVFHLAFPCDVSHLTQDTEGLSISFKDLRDIPSIRATVYTIIPSTSKGRLPPPTLLGSKETRNKLRVRYFILNYQKTKLGGPKESNKLMKKRAEDVLVEALRKSQVHNKRDRLWNRLRDTENPKSLNYNEFRELLSSSDVRGMEELDPSVNHLMALPAVFTLRCFDHVEEFYPSKRFAVEDTEHLVVFHDQNTFSHLLVDVNDNRLRLFTVTKSLKFDSSSCDGYMTDLINKILHWLWVILTN